MGWEAKEAMVGRVIDETSLSPLSDRHWEADAPGPGVLGLTGNSSCQVPLGNHLLQQFDYLFLSKDAQMVLFYPSLKALHSLWLFECICYDKIAVA